MEKPLEHGLINWLSYIPETDRSASELAEDMLGILVKTQTPPEYSETRLLSVYQGVAVEASLKDTVDELVCRWAEDRTRAMLAAQRVEPVRIAIAYLLDTLNEGDRDFLVRNFKYIEKKEDGVLCLR